MQFHCQTKLMFASQLAVVYHRGRKMRKPDDEPSNDALKRDTIRAFYLVLALISPILSHQ